MNVRHRHGKYSDPEGILAMTPLAMAKEIQGYGRNWQLFKRKYGVTLVDGKCLDSSSEIE